MKKAYNIHAAKTNFSEIIETVRSSREGVIIMNRGEPVAELIPIETQKKKKILGGLKGKAVFSPDWEKPLSDFEDYT